MDTVSSICGQFYLNKHIWITCIWQIKQQTHEARVVKNGKVLSLASSVSNQTGSSSALVDSNFYSNSQQVHVSEVESVGEVHHKQTVDSSGGSRHDGWILCEFLNQVIFLLLFTEPYNVCVRLKFIFVKNSFLNEFIMNWNALTCLYKNKRELKWNLICNML